MDVRDLKDALGPLVGEAVEQFFMGAASDLETYGQAIVEDLVEVQIVRATDPKLAQQLEDDLVDQLRVLAEANRIRLQKGTLSLLAGVMKVLVKAVVVGFAAGAASGGAM